MSRLLIGSRYFFSTYPNFQSKDIDEVEIIDTDEFQQIKHLSGQGRCLFTLKRHENKNEYIDWALGSSLGMVIGKFLVPEFCEEIGFTIEDLPKLAPLLDRLGDRHQYERIIYESYLENQAFYLTEAQRDQAYASYCASRNL